MIKHVLIGIILIVGSLFLLGCTTDNSSLEEGTQIANPASTFCIENGGNLNIVNTNEGQVGYCSFPNGQNCEEWAFFRGECSKELSN